MRLIISFLYIYIYVSLDEASELGTKATLIKGDTT